MIAQHSTTNSEAKANRKDPEESKFKHIQRKWGGIKSPPPFGLVSETEESDVEIPTTPKSPSKFITSGANTVKSLTSRFNQPGDEELSLESKAEALKETVAEQRREIDLLKAQVATKEAKIRQLEETLMKITTNSCTSIKSLGLVDFNGTLTTSSTA